MTIIHDGKHICPIMTRGNTDPVYCTEYCACLCSYVIQGEKSTYCGMMPPGE
jgi:hypothetical protein